MATLFIDFLLVTKQIIKCDMKLNDTHTQTHTKRLQIVFNYVTIFSLHIIPALSASPLSDRATQVPMKIYVSDKCVNGNCIVAFGGSTQTTFEAYTINRSCVFCCVFSLSSAFIVPTINRTIIKQNLIIYKKTNKHTCTYKLTHLADIDLYVW